MSDVFISYSRDDQEAVRRLAEAVKAQGYEVWWDDQLPPHLSYGDVVAQKVGGAKAAIVVWSANAAASKWVRAEAEMARLQRKLVQTTIDGAEPPMPFNQLHYVSLADWNGEPDHPAWTKVKESLAALAGPPAAAAAMPPPPEPAAPSGPVSPPEPVAPPSPPSPPPSATVPPRPSRGGNKLLIVLIVLSVLVIAGVGIMALIKSRSSGPAGNEASGEVANGAVPAGERFVLEAVLQGDDQFANLRQEAAADARIVARINAGETFTTYRQEGIWWEVKIAGGLTGYIERARIRLREPVGVPPLATPPPDNGATPAEPPVAVPPDQPPQPQAPQPQQQQPRPQQNRPPPQRPRADPRINQDNAGVMYEYCKGPGAGTRQCRQLGLGAERRRRQDY